MAPLPTSRNTSYSPGSPLHSADVNDIQDQIIALHAKQVDLTEARWLKADLVTGDDNGQHTASGARHTGLYTSSGGGGASSVHYFHVPLKAGDIVTGARAYVSAKSGSGSQAVSFRALDRTNTGFGYQTKGSILQSGFTGTGEMEATGGPYTVTDDDICVVAVELADENVTLSEVAVLVAFA